MKQRERARLGVRKRNSERLIHTWVSRDSINNLTEARVRYAALMGRPVSTSLIVRRALEHLREHLRTVKSPEAAAAETRAVERNRG